VSSTVDANVLLHASDETSRFHDQAAGLVSDLARGPELVYLFWPTVMAYLRIATHPSIFEAPLDPATAMANVENLLARPHVQTAGEQPRFWAEFRSVADDADARGNLVPDAHVVTLMRQNGVRTIWTHDRDYRRFPGLEVRDPFAG
jgi:toxin-antitoxin system PIN domain toxin